jgi:hypothetical protein
LSKKCGFDLGKTNRPTERGAIINIGRWAVEGGTAWPSEEFIRDLQAELEFDDKH